MSFRGIRKDAAESSDDEGPTKRLRSNEEGDDDGSCNVEKRVKHDVSGRKAWQDVALEESLTEAGSGIDFVDRKNDKQMLKIRRGAETYSVPKDMAPGYPKHSKSPSSAETARASPVSFADDSDPFGDSAAADLTEVEGFGVGPRGFAAARPTYLGRQVKGRGTAAKGASFWNGMGGKDESSQSKERATGDGESMEHDGGEGNSRNGRGGGGGWGSTRGGGGRGRGCQGYWNVRGRGGGSRGFKRSWDDRNTKNPAELMKADYSEASLQATEFIEGTPIEELGQQMADALGENTGDTLQKIVVAIGEKKALDLFEETRKAEASGGVKVADGSRRRTPGGVFILFFKTSVDIDPTIKAAIFECFKNDQRKTIRARRKGRGPQTEDFNKGLQDVADLMVKEMQKKIKDQASQEGQQASGSEEAKRKTSEVCEEVLDYGEDNNSMT